MFGLEKLHLFLCAIRCVKLVHASGKTINEFASTFTIPQHSISSLSIFISLPAITLDIVNQSQYVTRIYNSFLTFGFTVRHIRVQTKLFIALVNSCPCKPDAVSYSSWLVIPKGVPFSRRSFCYVAAITVYQRIGATLAFILLSQLLLYKSYETPASASQ